MNLNFSIKYPKDAGSLSGRHTYFVARILAGLIRNREHRETLEKFLKLKYGPEAQRWIRDAKIVEHKKIHTIRRDNSNRWAPGQLIHFYTGLRTRHANQFAPVITCTAVERIEISHKEYENKAIGLQIKVGGRVLNLAESIELAINDGFDSIEAFTEYFNEDFVGKVIHWTDKRYTAAEQIDVKEPVEVKAVVPFNAPTQTLLTATISEVKKGEEDTIKKVLKQLLQRKITNDDLEACSKHVLDTVEYQYYLHYEEQKLGLITFAQNESGFAWVFVPEPMPAPTTP